MNFENALGYIRDGKKLSRAGWNGVGMFVYLVEGSTFEVNRPPLNVIYPAGTRITYKPHIDMRCADGECVPWLVSQSDLLACDWGIVE